MDEFEPLSEDNTGPPGASSQEGNTCAIHAVTRACGTAAHKSVMVNKKVAQGTEALVLRHHPEIKETGTTIFHLMDTWQKEFGVPDEQLHVKVVSMNNEKKKEKIVTYLHEEGHLHEKKDENKHYHGIVLMLETNQDLKHFVFAESVDEHGSFSCFDSAKDTDVGEDSITTYESVSDVLNIFLVRCSKDFYNQLREDTITEKKHYEKAKERAEKLKKQLLEDGVSDDEIQEMVREEMMR